MRYILENKKLRVTINSLGAEVISVIDKKTGRELVWEGDVRFWNGHGPVLFPACGGLWNGEYTLDDNNYHMPKHGLVRHMEWELNDQDDDEEEGCQWVVLIALSNDETKVNYPYDFELLISYELCGAELNCNYIVRNNEESRVMPFQIGGHPSVSLPNYIEKEENAGINKDIEEKTHDNEKIDNNILSRPIGYLKALSHHAGDIDAHCLSVVRVGEQGCWRPERYPAPCNAEGLIPICVETFYHEALIFDRDQISGFRVLDAHKRKLATIRSDAPVFLVWQPQGKLSPFVCIEPWYGLCDQEGCSTKLIERPYSRCVMPEDERWGTLYSIEFNV